MNVVNQDKSTDNLFLTSMSIGTIVGGVVDYLSQKDVIKILKQHNIKDTVELSKKLGEKDLKLIEKTDRSFFENFMKKLIETSKVHWGHLTERALGFGIGLAGVVILAKVIMDLFKSKNKE